MIDEKTMEKVTKIKEILDNRTDGQLVAKFGDEEFEFDDLLMNENGVFVHGFDGGLNVDKIDAIFLKECKVTKLM